MLLPLQAAAVTLDGFKDQGLEEIYGSYAPGGDCKRQPLLVIDDRGLTFTVAGRTVTQSRVEYAVSYMGSEYDGIAKVFFPFPEGDYEMGPIVMMVNDAERPGEVGFDSNLGPGQRLQSMHAALAGTRLVRCAGAAPSEAATRKGR